MQFVRATPARLLLHHAVRALSQAADPGFDPSWRALLSRRAGRLVFAGEHASTRWQGYMNGAVESGVRAARELIKKSH